MHSNPIPEVLYKNETDKQNSGSKILPSLQSRKQNVSDNSEATLTGCAAHKNLAIIQTQIQAGDIQEEVGANLNTLSRCR